MTTVALNAGSILNIPLPSGPRRHVKMRVPDWKSLVREKTEAHLVFLTNADAAKLLEIAAIFPGKVTARFEELQNGALGEVLVVTCPLGAHPRDIEFSGIPSDTSALVALGVESIPLIVTQLALGTLSQLFGKVFP